MSTGLLILTIVHVIISLVGIGSGFVVIYGFLTAQRLDAGPPFSWRSRS